MLVFILFVLSYIFSGDLPEKIETCTASNAYYDITSMACLTCDASIFLIPDSDKRSCICMEGRFKQYSAAGDGTYTCELCAEASTRDRLVCQGCANGTTFNSVTRDCVCTNSNYKIVEYGTDGNYLTNKTCQSCKYNEAISSTDPYTCETKCDSTEIWSGGVCSCLLGTTDYVKTDYGCVLKNPDVLSYDGSIEITQIKELSGSGESSEFYTSPYLKRLFQKHVGPCLGERNPESCNAIANLCVLNLYDDQKICSVYRSQYNVITQPNVYSGNVYSGWKLGYPWLEYTDNQREVILKDKEAFLSDLGFISSKIKTIKFVISRYTVEGKWLGYKTMTTELLLCGNEEEDESRYLRIGTNVKKKCNLNVNKLRYLPETEIWELFVQDTEENSLKPVPVQIISTNEDGISYKYYHRSNNEIKMYRRFMMYDNVVLPDEYIRYVSKARLQMTMRSGSQSMYIPILTLRYSSRKIPEITGDEILEENLNYTTLTGSNIGSPEVKFEVEYDEDQLIFYIVVSSLTFILILLGEIVSVFNCYLYLTKRYERQFRFPVLGKLLSETCNNTANAMCCGIVFFTFWYFFFFKLQAIVFIMVPTSIQNITFYVVLPVTMILKFLNICFVNYEHTHYDVFFVDWEDPQGTALIVDDVAKNQFKMMQGIKIESEDVKDEEGEGEGEVGEEELEQQSHDNLNNSKIIVDGYGGGESDGIEVVNNNNIEEEEEISIRGTEDSVGIVDPADFSETTTELEEGGLSMDSGDGITGSDGGGGDDFYIDGDGENNNNDSGMFVTTNNPDPSDYSDSGIDRPPSSYPMGNSQELRGSQMFTSNNNNNQQSNNGKKTVRQFRSNRDPLNKTPVSCWRTHLVANQWLALCNEGYVNIEFTLLCICFFLTGLRLSNLAFETHDGLLACRDDITTNPVLRFAVSTIFFVFIGMVQYCYKKCFHFRFIRDPVRNFVDLCVTTNVSVFVLPELYYGYYIHGQAPYKYSDTDLFHFGTYIEQERNHTFPKRGLIPKGRDGGGKKTKGCVCFQVYVSPKLREVFDGYSSERARGLAERRRRRTELFFKPAKNLKRVNVDANQLTNIRFYSLFYPENPPYMMKSLYCKYVECNDTLRQMIKDLKNDSDRIVNRDCSHRCGFPPSSQLRSSKKSVFIKDYDFSFTKIFIRGSELKFLSFYILLFSTFDMFIKNAVVSSLIVYCLYRIIKCSRYWMSFKNIQKKTLLDSRFFL